MLFSATYPNKIRSLTLLAPAGLPVAMPRWATFLLQTPVLGSYFFKFIVTPRIKKAYPEVWSRPDAPQIEEWYQICLLTDKQHDGYFRSMLSTLIHFPMGSCTEQIRILAKAYKGKTLIIWGDKDTVCPFENAYKLKALFPEDRSELVVVPNQNHNFVIEFPDTVVKPLLELIK